MADVHSKKVRSYNMSQIRSKNTKPEMLVRSYLHKHGYRFRLHDKKLPGKPDIVLPKYKTVIFVNGCFWHGHKRCKRYVEPKSKKNYWIPKIDRNRTNQEKQKRKLKYLGWKIFTIWECNLKMPKFNKVIIKLINLLNN